MQIRYDFSPNVGITDRILASLRNCSSAELIKLANAGKIRMKDFILTERSISAEHLEDYAKNTNASLLYYFYGVNSIVPKYTPYDGYVISYLNSRSPAELKALKDHLLAIFPNNFYKASPVAENNRNRLGLVLRRMPKGTFLFESFDDIGIPAYKNLNDSIVPELLRFKNSHYTPLFTFHCKYWVDLATFAGVSLHWLFYLKSPLFCTTQLGDEVFDYYTLMQPSQQEQFIKLILVSVKYQIDNLSKTFLEVNLLQ